MMNIKLRVLFILFLIPCLLTGDAFSQPDDKAAKKKNTEVVDAEELKKFTDLVASFNDAKVKKSQIKKIVPVLCKDGLGHESATVFRLCFEALSASKNEEVYKSIATFIKKNKSENPYLVSACFNLLRHSNDPKKWEVGIKYLKSENDIIGIMAAELVGQGVRKAIPVLMKSLKKVKTRRLTVTMGVLAYLIGEKITMDVIDFENWWELNKKTYSKKAKVRVGEKLIEFHQVKRLSASSYHGQKIDIANTMFCMDTSNSMKPDDPVERPKDKRYTTNPDAFPLLPAGNGSRIWEARRALATALKTLHKDIKFGVITFGGQIDAYNEAKMAPASDKKNLVEAYKFVLYETPLTLGTWLYQSVGVALQNSDVEVIYLLTDGAPASVGSGQSGSIPMKKNHELRQKKYFQASYINDCVFREYHTRRVVIHTILFGKEGSKGEKILSDISRISHGEFKVVDIGKKKNKNKNKKKKKPKEAK